MHEQLSSRRFCSGQLSVVPQKSSGLEEYLTSEGTRCHTIAEQSQQKVMGDEAAKNDFRAVSATKPQSLNSKEDQLPPILESRLTQFLQSYVEPVTVRSSRARRHCNFAGSLCYWIGPTLVRRWTEDGRESFQVSGSSFSSGFAYTIRLRCMSKAMTLSIMPYKSISPSLTWSMQWSLSFPSIIPHNAAIVELAKRGDIENVRRMFEVGKAACTDATSDGTSLLHVSPSPITHKTRC